MCVCLCVGDGQWRAVFFLVILCRGSTGISFFAISFHFFTCANLFDLWIVIGFGLFDLWIMIESKEPKEVTRNVHALWSDSLRMCVNYVQMIHVWNQL